MLPLEVIRIAKSISRDQMLACYSMVEAAETVATELSTQFQYWKETEEKWNICIEIVRVENDMARTVLAAKLVGEPLPALLYEWTEFGRELVLEYLAQHYAQVAEDEARLEAMMWEG